MISDEQVKRFWEALTDTGNVTTASQRAGISRASGYSIRNEHPELAEEAHRGYLDKLESIFTDAAIHGLVEDIVVEGKVVGQKKKQAATMLVKLLESKHPDFKPRQAIEHSGNLDIKNKDDDELLAEIESLRASVNE